MKKKYRYIYIERPMIIEIKSEMKSEMDIEIKR